MQKLLGGLTSSNPHYTATNKRQGDLTLYRMALLSVTPIIHYSGQALQKNLPITPIFSHDPPRLSINREAAVSMRRAPTIRHVTVSVCFLVLSLAPAGCDIISYNKTVGTYGRPHTPSLSPTEAGTCHRERIEEIYVRF